MLAGGGSHSVVLTHQLSSADVAVYTFGRNDDGQLGIGTPHDTHQPSAPPLNSNMPPLLLAAAGASHTVLCDTDGQVAAALHPMWCAYLEVARVGH